jgi:GGDEF domain-containing protein
VVTKSFSGPPGRPGPGPARSRPTPAPNPSELGLLDPATGAGSNRALRRDLAQAFAAPGPAAGVHLVALQVEPLPDIRRREGDAAAERLLRTAVETVSPLLRARDRIYRTGPNQLALLLRSVGEDGVEAALARLARQVPGLLAERGVSGVRIVLRRVHVRHSELPGAPAPGTVTR